MTILLAALALAAQAMAPPSTLCIEDRCQPVRTVPTPVAASETPRNFVWISAELDQVITGRIEAHATAVTLPDPSQLHKLVPRLSDGAVKAKIDFELRCQDVVWKWSIPRVPARGVELRHTGAGCTLMIASDRYEKVERPLRDTDLGTLFLQKLPVLSGTVTDATTATPIGHAEVLSPAGKLLAATDEKGRFRSSVSGPWPQFIRVATTGYATRTIPLSKVAADADLSIRLSKGGSLTISLAAPLGQEEVKWEVRRLLAASRDELTRSGRLEAGQANAFVEGLEPSKYRVILMGSEPLQRLGTVVAVSDGANTDTTMQIAPAALEISVRYGDQAVGEATVHLFPRDESWSSSVKTDSEGNVTEEVWQEGPYVAMVTHLPEFPFWLEKGQIHGGEKNRWRISVPKRRLHGSVIDDASGQPIGDARVVVTMRADAAAPSIPLKSGADGTFELGAFPAGRYMLEVTRTGYRSSRTPWMSVDETTVDVTPVVRLKPVGNRPLAVTNASGAPLAAIVYVSSRNGTRFVGVTDEQGHMSLPVDPDEYGTIFVLPRSGSIGIARFESLARGPEEVIVRVPDGTASLEVTAETTSGAALRGVGVLLRIDGVLLPIPVWEEMVNSQGYPMLSDAQGRLLFTHLPPGRYEIWPLSREELRAVASGSPPPAPVNIAVTAGYQSAKLVFAKAKP